MVFNNPKEPIMDTQELIELGEKLGLSGKDLKESVFAEQDRWREEMALELEAEAREEQALQEIAEIEKARAAIDPERKRSKNKPRSCDYGLRSLRRREECQLNQRAIGKPMFKRELSHRRS